MLESESGLYEAIRRENERDAVADKKEWGFINAGACMSAPSPGITNRNKALLASATTLYASIEFNLSVEQSVETAKNLLKEIEK